MSSLHYPGRVEIGQYLPDSLVNIVCDYVIAQQFFDVADKIQKSLPRYLKELSSSVPRTKVKGNQTLVAIRLMYFRTIDRIGRAVTIDFLSMKTYYAKYQKVYGPHAFLAKKIEDLTAEYARVIGGTAEGNLSRF